MDIFKAFIIKEFRHVWRDKRSLLILLGLPVMMMMIFGFALSSEVKNSKFGVLDFSHSEASSQVINRLAQSPYFDLEVNLSNYQEIEGLFQAGRIRMALIIPEDFAMQKERHGPAQIQLIGDASDANTSGTMIQYASAIIRDIQQDWMGEASLPFEIKVDYRMLYNPQLESSYNFVPGVLTLILMLLGAMMTSVSIVREKELGTMEVLLVSPMKPIWVVLSKAIPYLILCFVDVLIILLLSYTVLDMPLRGSLLLLLLECILFIITTLSLGLLISTIVDSQEVAMFLSLVGFLMPALVFSGFMFPIENMPVVLQYISNVVPTRWFYEILKTVMIKGLGIEYILKETLILSIMTLFFIVIALKKFKIRLA